MELTQGAHTPPADEFSVAVAPRGGFYTTVQTFLFTEPALTKPRDGRYRPNL